MRSSSNNWASPKPCTPAVNHSPNGKTCGSRPNVPSSSNTYPRSPSTWISSRIHQTRTRRRKIHLRHPWRNWSHGRRPRRSRRHGSSCRGTTSHPATTSNPFPWSWLPSDWNWRRGRLVLILKMSVVSRFSFGFCFFLPWAVVTHSVTLKGKSGSVYICYFVWYLEIAFIKFVMHNLNEKTLTYTF